MNEQYLFPFERIPSNAKIIIYGAGELGQSYYRQISLTKYCQIVGMIDQNFARYQNTPIKVYAPSDLAVLDFDMVVIAAKYKDALPEINRILDEAGVLPNQIVHIGCRAQLPKNFAAYASSATDIIKPADGRPRLAFLFSAGLGGFWFIKRFVVELLKDVADATIDVYCQRFGEQAKFFFSDIPNINTVTYNLGTRYDNVKNGYDLSLTISAEGFVRVDVFKEESFADKYADFVEKMRRFCENTDKDEYIDTMPRISLFQHHRYNGKNAYTALGYDVYDLSDKRTTVPCSVEGYGKFVALNLKTYITVNYGNGSCKDGSKIAKMWPKENFEKTLKMFRAKYTDIEAVQLGTNDAEKLDNVDRHVLGYSFDVVAHVLKNAVFHFDIEGGLVHMASQLGTKCFVIFGPTPEFYYGYADNVNIKAGDCHDCYGVCLDINACARQMPHPACMYSITPTLVMTKIDEYMKTQQK